ncbi:MAG: ATP-binding cassette domain-containing protein [Gemmatimonadota bacterium]
MASASPAPAIALDRLTRRFGDHAAVEELSFTVAPGTLHGLVGPDGAGKTTTLRMLAGVLAPTSGDARIEGVSVRDAPETVKHFIAYMPQRFGLYTDLTVRENIDFFADLYGIPPARRPARLEELFAFSGLGPFQHRMAGQLSGGMKQKLALCACLIHHPRVLLLDEPTLGVDPISRRELWLLLHRMVADGLTVLLSTAYLDEAERCDRVTLLHHGRALADDAPERLQRSLPGTMLEIRGADPRRAAGVLRDAPGVRRVALFGETVHALYESPDAERRSRDTLAAAGLRTTAIAVIEPSLEDVFIERVASREAQLAAAGA